MEGNRSTPTADRAPSSPAAAPPTPPVATPAPPPPSLHLSELPPDVWTGVITRYLSTADLAQLAATCSSMRAALEDNAGLWAALFSKQFPQPFAALQQQQQQAGPSSSSHSSSNGIDSGSWRQRYLAAHDATRRLLSVPAVRSWCSDVSPISTLQLHGPRQLTLASQAEVVELRTAGARARSFQLFGHGARVTAVALTEQQQQGQQQQRMGVVTTSADQTLRLWSLPPSAAQLHEDDPGPASLLTLLTPTRTLRGHTEGITCLQLIAGAGVVIAATGAKDRSVRLWGLAPLLPSPVSKPAIATLRGHGAPITALAAVPDPGSGSASEHGAGSGGGPPSFLLSASLDGRAKLWDVWSAALVGTARLAGPASALQLASHSPALQPHGAFVACGAGVQLLDLRSRGMSAVATLAPPPSAGPAVRCMAQWGDSLAVGGDDGCRVYDLRRLSSGFGSGSGGGGGRGGAGVAPRLLLQGHAGAVGSVHVDRLKVVTATEAYGEHPLRVWCPETGELLAAFDSAKPEQPASPWAAPAVAAGGDLQLLQALAAAAAGDEVALAAAEAAQAALVAAAADEAVVAGGAAGQQQQQQQQGGGGGRYRREWEGVTALACVGARLVSGNSEGVVMEQDFSRGLGLREEEGGAGGEPHELGGSKFWA